VGNVVRINNALEKISENLERQKQGLITLESELENAKEEAARPFPQEAELEEKSARLSELNTELDNDGKGGKEEEKPQESSEHQERKEECETPAGVPSAPLAPGGGKPSILKQLQQFAPPPSVRPERNRARQMEAAL